MAATPRRLRLIEARSGPEDSNRAFVGIAIDNYNTGGVFNSGSTWTMSAIIERGDGGAWKINVDEFFY